jgi:hypothetical protein
MGPGILPEEEIETGAPLALEVNQEPRNEKRLQEDIPILDRVVGLVVILLEEIIEADPDEFAAEVLAHEESLIHHDEAAVTHPDTDHEKEKQSRNQKLRTGVGFDHHFPEAHRAINNIKLARIISSLVLLTLISLV